MLAAADGEPVEPVQLQKSLFLIDKNVRPEEKGIARDFYAFRPYDYGPFDPQVYGDAARLSQEGLVKIGRRPGRSFREYTATPEGLAYAQTLGGELPPQDVEYVRQVVSWARGLTFSELVRAIYWKYPEQRARSVFND